MAKRTPKPTDPAQQSEASATTDEAPTEPDAESPLSDATGEPAADGESGTSDTPSETTDTARPSEAEERPLKVDRAKALAKEQADSVAQERRELASLKDELDAMGDPSAKRNAFNAAYKAKLAQVTEAKAALDEELRAAGKNRTKIFVESQALLAKAAAIRSRIKEIEKRLSPTKE